MNQQTKLPKILGDDQPKPDIVWACDCGGEMDVSMPENHPDGDGFWLVAFTSPKAAEVWAGEIFPTTLDERKHSAKVDGDNGVILIDESYRVIDVYPVTP